MVHQIRIFMEKNKYLRKWVDPIRNTKVMRYLKENVQFLRFAKDEKPAFTVFYGAHKAELEKVSRMLADDFSRKTLQTVIDYRLDPRGGTGWHSCNAAVFYA